MVHVLYIVTYNVAAAGTESPSGYHRETCFNTLTEEKGGEIMMEASADHNNKSEPQDCLPCRITGIILEPFCSDQPLTNAGTAAFVGLGGYTYYAGTSNLRQQQQQMLMSGARLAMGPRQLGVITLSAALMGLGVWRALR